MTRIFRSNSGSARSSRLSTRLSRIRTLMKRRAAFARGCFAARPARSPFVNDEEDSTFRLTSGAGFKKVAVVLAIKAGVPIVPVACSGAHRVMEKGSLVIHPGEIIVEFLEPIDTSKYSLDERDVLNEHVRDVMAAGLPPDQRPIGFPGANAEADAS